MTKDQLLREIRAARADWERAFQLVPRTDLRRPAVIGRWSVADLVAHITWYDQEMVGVLTARRLAGSP